MTRAVVAIGFGGPENLKVVDVADTSPEPGEVLLEVRAIGVNPIDAKLYSGMFGTDPASLPRRLGSEAAGVVLAVGEGATGPRGPVSVGDEVIVYGVPGAYADRLVVPASAVVPKPAAMSFEEASGLMLAGVTAVHALTVVHPAAGETLLLHGGAGAVGLTAIQLATARGVRVIATASAANHDLVREVGAEPVGYGDGLADRVRALAPDGVAAAIDTVGSDEALDVSVELVADRSRVVTIAGFAHGAELGVVRIGGGPGADPGTEIRAAARLELLDAVVAGGLRVPVADTFPLSDAAAAHRAVLGRHRPGKLVLLP